MNSVAIKFASEFPQHGMIIRAVLVLLFVVKVFHFQTRCSQWRLIWKSLKCSISELGWKRKGLRRSWRNVAHTAPTVGHLLDSINHIFITYRDNFVASTFQLRDFMFKMASTVLSIFIEQGDSFRGTEKDKNV
jgi:hypothetical protein